MEMQVMIWRTEILIVGTTYLEWKTENMQEGKNTGDSGSVVCRHS